jgi:hypothetical protein
VSTTSGCRRGKPPSRPVSSSMPGWRCSPAPGTVPGSMIPRGSRGHSGRQTTVVGGQGAQSLSAICSQFRVGLTTRVKRSDGHRRSPHPNR